MIASLINPVKSHLCDLPMPRPAGLGPEMRGSLQQERELHRRQEVQQKRDTNSRCTEAPDERSQCIRVLCCASLRLCTVSSGTSNRYLGCHSLSRATVCSYASAGTHQRGVLLWCRVLNSCLLWNCSCPCHDLCLPLCPSVRACPSRRVAVSEHAVLAENASAGCEERPPLCGAGQPQLATVINVNQCFMRSA